jgi:hypothetical protein
MAPVVLLVLWIKLGDWRERRAKRQGGRTGSEEPSP